MSAPTYRCSACGLRRGSTSIVRDGRPRRTVLACDAHPDAPVLEWNSVHQAAAIWIDQTVNAPTSAITWDDVLMAITAAPECRRKTALLTVYPLMRAWNGLPERQLPPRPDTDTNALFAPSLRERLMS